MRQISCESTYELRLDNDKPRKYPLTLAGVPKPRVVSNVIALYRNNGWRIVYITPSLQQSKQETKAPSTGGAFCFPLESPGVPPTFSVHISRHISRHIFRPHFPPIFPATFSAHISRPHFYCILFYFGAYFPLTD